MNKKYLTIGAAIAVIIVVVAAIAYFYFSKKTLYLPTDNLATAEAGQTTDAASATTTAQNEAVSIKDRTLKKDGFTILVPAGWAEVNYMAGATIITNPGEENLDPALKKSGFTSYFSVTREKMGEKTWEQAVVYVETIVNGSAPEIKYLKQEDGKMGGLASHYWEADLTRADTKFKVLIYAVRGQGDDLWILTFNTGASMWPAYTRLTPKVFDSFRLI